VLSEVLEGASGDGTATGVVSTGVVFLEVTVVLVVVVLATASVLDSCQVVGRRLCDFSFSCCLYVALAVPTPFVDPDSSKNLCVRGDLCLLLRRAVATRSVAKGMAARDDTNTKVLLFGATFYHYSSFADIMDL
jgi:hypothetical protein